MKINQKLLGMLIVTIIFGTVFISSRFGLWQTTNTKIPQKYTSADYQDQYDPADIKGSYTFGEISQLYQVPIDDLVTAFSIDAGDASSFKCKDLESMYDKADGKEIGTDSVRLFVALYKGLPYTLNSSTYLPVSAEEVLLIMGNMTDEQKQFVASHKK